MSTSDRLIEHQRQQMYKMERERYETDSSQSFERWIVPESLDVGDIVMLYNSDALRLVTSISDESFVLESYRGDPLTIMFDHQRGVRYRLVARQFNGVECGTVESWSAGNVVGKYRYDVSLDIGGGRAFTGVFACDEDIKL